MAEDLERWRSSGLAETVDLVAAWLPDKTPLAATARFARCAAHFRSYLVASAALTAFSCFHCGGVVRCIVLRHHHTAPGFIVYEGRGRDEGRGQDVSYVWYPAIECCACQRCATDLGFDPALWAKAMASSRPSSPLSRHFSDN
jgi:hypothetical protein